MLLLLASCRYGPPPPPGAGGSKACDIGHRDTPCEGSAAPDAEDLPACAEDDADQLFLRPEEVEDSYDSEGADFGYTAGFLSDVDGDGGDEVVIAAPGSVVFEAGQFTHAIHRTVYFSSRLCGTDLPRRADEPDLDVPSTDGVLEARSLSLWGMTQLSDLGDLDGDGLSEVGSIDYLPGVGSVIAAYEGNRLREGGEVPFADAVAWILSDGSGGPLALLPAGDSDGDMEPEILVQGTWDIRRFVAETMIDGPSLYSDSDAVFPGGWLAWGPPTDLDGDGIDEVVLTAARHEGNPYDVLVWRGGPGGGVLGADSADWVVGETTGGSWRLHDLNADGTDDLLVQYEAPAGESIQAAVILGAQLVEGIESAGDAWTLIDGAGSSFGDGPIAEGGLLSWGEDGLLRRFDRADIVAGGHLRREQAVEAFEGEPFYQGFGGDVDGDGSIDALVGFSGPTGGLFLSP